MKCAAAFCISGKSARRLAAGVDQHHDRVVGRADGEHFARDARFLNHEVVGADVDERPVAGIGDGGQRDAAGAGLLLTALAPARKITAMSDRTRASTSLAL